MKTKLFVLIAVGALTIFAAYAIIRSLGYEVEKQEKNLRYYPLEEAKKDALDLWIDRLADEFECVDCADNFRHLDKNNLYSYGCLQFQKDTFYAEVRRHEFLPFAEDAEFMNFIYDCSTQKKLAKKMLLENSENWQHWFTSVVIRGLGKPPNGL